MINCKYIQMEKAIGPFSPWLYVITKHLLFILYLFICLFAFVNMPMCTLVNE